MTDKAKRIKVPLGEIVFNGIFVKSYNSNPKPFLLHLIQNAAKFRGGLLGPHAGLAPIETTALVHWFVQIRFGEKGVRAK